MNREYLPSIDALQLIEIDLDRWKDYGSCPDEYEEMCNFITNLLVTSGMSAKGIAEHAKQMRLGGPSYYDWIKEGMLSDSTSITFKGVTLELNHGDTHELMSALMQVSTDHLLGLLPCRTSEVVDYPLATLQPVLEADADAA